MCKEGSEYWMRLGLSDATVPVSHVAMRKLYHPALQMKERKLRNADLTEAEGRRTILICHSFIRPCSHTVCSPKSRFQWQRMTSPWPIKGTCARSAVARAALCDAKPLSS